MIAVAPVTDPYTIYANARQYWETAPYPSSVSYVVHVSVDQNGVPKESHYHCDAVSNGSIYVDAVSDEERAHPHVVSGGPNWYFTPFGASVPLSKPEDPVDYLGVPQLRPNYAFGIAKHVGEYAAPEDLVAKIRRQFHDPPPRNKSVTTDVPPPIASVEALHHDYAITLEGTDDVNGHPDYHLRLSPVRDPQRFRLRELWVDKTTWATDKLTTQGNFTDGPSLGVVWSVTFAQIDGAPYIETEQTAAQLTLDARNYTNVRISFEQIGAAQLRPRQALAAVHGGRILAEPDDL